MPKKLKAFYAQSGGVTPVINASACGLIQTAQAHGIKVYAGRYGILGALNEELIDLSLESKKTIEGLRTTPGGAFGSCRYKLKNLDENRAEYERLLAVFKAHDIGYFFYNGGGDSQDTALKISQLSRLMNYPLRCIGIPKTIDNDLPITDNCPGFGSVAKYVATSIREASLDLASMCSTSTQVFILEVMGRHAGWIAAAAGLSAETANDPPQIILFPEIPWDEQKLMARVTRCIKEKGYCSIVVSEGLKNKEGIFLSETGGKDAFGHAQLGGVAPIVAHKIKQTLNLKCHWAVADYLQRSARHIASKTDVEQAYALGKSAMELALSGQDGIMVTLVRKPGAAYRWTTGYTPLSKVANKERGLPRSYITPDGFHITPACRKYLYPLIQGEDFPPFKKGLPDYVQLKNIIVPKRLPAWKEK